MHDLIVHDYGPGRCFASLHVEVPDTVDIVSCHEQIDACEKKVFDKLGVVLVIHMDPIATKDERRNAIDLIVKDIICSIDETLSYHDLRIVDGEKTEMYVKVGDKVLLSKYAGTEVKVDGVEYQIIRQSDILAIVE